MNTTYMQIDYDAQELRQIEKQRRVKSIGHSKDAEDKAEGHRAKKYNITRGYKSKINSKLSEEE